MRAKAVFGWPLREFGGSSALLKVGKTSKDGKILGDNNEYEGVISEVISIEFVVSRSWKKIFIGSVSRNEVSSNISLNSVGKEVVVLGSSGSSDSKSKGSGVDTARD